LADKPIEGSTQNTMSNDILILNRALALSRVGGDEDLLREIAGLFLDDYPHLVVKIQESLAANDANGLERASHSLKGSVANFGAEPAYQAALELERIGRSNDLTQARAAYQRLEESLHSLQPELLSLAGH
jgi:HPt (histidine-containing phosphotransfer) domain-containing protein